MENTVNVQVLRVCNTVKPSLVFHTGGMFVILINVSIFRMLRGRKLFIHIEAALQVVMETCVLVLG